MGKTLMIFLAICSLQAHCQTQAFFVKPSQTDAAYTTAQDSNFIAYDLSIPSNDKLLVFLPGTGALTKHYLLFPKLAASMGYHCIGLAYPNGSPTVAQLCAGNPDADCYKNIRQEVCYGTNVSTNVSVDTFNSIRVRLIKLLQYLNTQYPSAGWGQFLNGNEPKWAEIAASGHSQGAGHALYLSKTNSTYRVIMFAGADDYSNYYSQAANWVSMSSQTLPGRLFSFLHFNDDVWDYSKQYAVMQAAGMTMSDDSTLVDTKLPPYSYSRCLYTKRTPLYPAIYSSWHNGMVVDFYTPLDGMNEPVYKPVWNYLLSDESLGVEPINTISFQLYPNPAQDHFFLTTKRHYKGKVHVISIEGKPIREFNMDGSSLDCNMTGIPAGLYCIICGSGRTLISLK